jgi:DNA-binding response OmpR family regulator
VLVVEDDPELRRQLARGLGEEGFAVLVAADAAAALRHDHAQLDLVVIDVGLPDADGRDLCQALRARGFAAPVLFLTARDAVTDRVSGFTAGGDDYVTKPFAFVELVVRLQALLRRSGSEGREGLHVDGLALDPATHAATGPDRPGGSCSRRARRVRSRRARTDPLRAPLGPGTAAAGAARRDRRGSLRAHRPRVLRATSQWHPEPAATR